MENDHDDYDATQPPFPFPVPRPRRERAAKKKDLAERDESAVKKKGERSGDAEGREGSRWDAPRLECQNLASSSTSGYVETFVNIPEL